LSQQELLEALLKYQQMWNNKSWENKIEKKMAKATKKLDEAKIKALSEFIVTLK
jgi:cytochrome c553